jgi:HD-GYP domain-containing protein (c-di-GMP phosphodiesterase class II)
VVSISKILRKAEQREKEAKDKTKDKTSPTKPQKKEQQNTPEKDPSQKTKPVSVIKAVTLTRQKEKQEPEKNKIRISPLVLTKDQLLDQQEIQTLYTDAVTLTRKIHKKALTSDTLECGKITEFVDTFTEQLMLENDALLAATAGESEPYLYSHAVNVCILSLKIGIGLGYEKAGLQELGSSAFVHDIGMMRYLNVACQPRVLSEDEYTAVKYHPITGTVILKVARGLPEVAIDVALQHHEREDGSGYPLAVKGETIHEYSRIIAMVDVYDSLTHTRPYRDRFLPFEAIEKVLKAKGSFDERLVKAFIEEIGLFPVGCLVRLNAGEIAKVVKVNRGLPTRPVVEIIASKDNEKSKENKVIDLKEQRTINVTESVKEENV